MLRIYRFFYNKFSQNGCSNVFVLKLNIDITKEILITIIPECGKT